jgi:hypothetical protein
MIGSRDQITARIGQPKAGSMPAKPNLAAKTNSRDSVKRGAMRYVQENNASETF